MLVYTSPDATTPVNVGARASAPGEISHIPLAPPKTPDGEREGDNDIRFSERESQPQLRGHTCITRVHHIVPEMNKYQQSL